MRALIILGLVLLTAPWSALAAPVPEDVAWLADLAGVAPSDLPPAVPGREGAFGPQGFAERDRVVPIADFAREVRGLHTEGAGAAEPVFLGAGVVGVTGSGARWSGLALGPAASMPCMTVTFVQDLGPTGRGNAYVGMHSEVPFEAILGSGGVARMDAMAYPSPGTSAAIATPAADGLLTNGGYATTCVVFFTLRVSTATFGGDGTVSADGQ